MNLLLQKATAYGKEILGRKKRLIVAGIVFILLLALSFYFMFDGTINKKVIIFTGLSFLTALFLVLPKIKNKYVSLAFSVLYLILVPQKMFDRIELPSYDMSNLLDGAALMNYLIIILIYAVILLLSQSVSMAFGLGGIVIGILFTINYVVLSFRGVSFTFSDLFSVKTALMVADTYEFTVSAEFWYSILYFLFFIVLGFWCGFVWERKMWYHIAVSSVAVVYIVGFLLFWNNSDYLEERGLVGAHWIPSFNQPSQGFLLSFGINMKEMYVGKPDGYSNAALEEIISKAEGSYQAVDLNTDVEKPNIIVIMNESWSDLSVLGNVETNISYMSTYEALEENTVKGNLHVSVLGGLTANSEYEFLTGNSMVFLPSNAVPYQLQLNHNIYSMATVLKEQGYGTMAMHPSIETAWNRDEVYPYLGFDEFIDVYKFNTEYGYVRAYISDACNYDELIWQFEHKAEGQPLYLFDVTIQNHGGYGGGVNSGVYFEKIGNSTADTWGDVIAAETVVNLMKITDNEFARLIEYFENVEEPTLICMFGDHQPILTNEFYDMVFEGQNLTSQEQEAKKYITPYIIWANYDVDFPEYGDMSANYLGAAVLECAGVELPPYYKMLLQMQKEVPVVSFQTIGEIEEMESIKKYKMVQYNQLIDKQSNKELFSVTGE